MKLKNLVFGGAALCAVTLSTSAFADKLADIKAQGYLTCGTLTSSEPLGFPDPQTRQIVGFDVDTCAAVAKHLGVAMHHKGVSVEARIAELQMDRVDLVAAALGYTKERAKQIDFTSVHYQLPIKLIAHSNAGYTNIKDLAEKKISANKGSTPELYARQAFPKATVVTFQDSPATFLALAQNKVQAMAISEASGLRFVNDSGGAYKFLDGSLAWEPTALGVKKGETNFLNAVNKALEEMEADGELDTMWNKWFGPQTKYFMKREKKLTPISAFE